MIIGKSTRERLALFCHDSARIKQARKDFLEVPRFDGRLGHENVHYTERSLPLWSVIQ